MTANLHPSCGNPANLTRTDFAYPNITFRHAESLAWCYASRPLADWNPSRGEQVGLTLFHPHLGPFLYQNQRKSLASSQPSTLLGFFDLSTRKARSHPHSLSVPCRLVQLDGQLIRNNV